MHIMDTTLHLRQLQNMTGELETKKKCRLVALQFPEMSLFPVTSFIWININ